MRGFGALAVVLALSPACTFGQLASYDIESCDPAADEQYAGAGGTAPDVCDRLNGGNTASCTPWQCDPATSRCVPRTRDDDRDGDPPAACGGGDCDDTDPNLNSLRVATPSVLGDVSLGSDPRPTLSYDGTSAVLAYVTEGEGGPCVSMGRVASGGVSGCTATVAAGDPPVSSAPAQPFGLELGGGALGVAFVATSGCPAGALAFDAAATPEVMTLDACGAGAALPAAAMVASGKAVLGYYATPPLADPISSCPNAVAASLVVVPVANVGSIGEQAFGAKAALTTMAVSVRPPAIAVESSVVFVASPDGAAASLWALDAGTLTTKATTTIPSLANARGVSMGVRVGSDGTMRIAVVAELECSPQAIELAFVDYDPTSATFSATGEAQVSAATGGLQTAPTIAWSAARSRWMAAWVASGPRVAGRFIDDAAVPSEPAFTVMNGGLGAVALATAHVALVATEGANGDVLVDSEARCP